MAPIKEVKEIAEAQQVIPQAKRLCSALEGFKVTSQDSYKEAGDKMKLVKERIKQVERIKSNILNPINEARKNTISFFDTPLSLLKTIKDTLDKKMSFWRNEQLEKERIATEKAEAEAREKERVEKERLRKKAEEQDRIARKAKEEADAAKKKADDLARSNNIKQAEKAKLEADKKIQKAKELKEEVKETKQEAREVEVEAKTVKPKVEKIEGLHFRRYWKARIVDANKIPRVFLKPNEVAINNYITINKKESFIPGIVVFFEDKTIG